ncbi:MAG: phospholipase effector Tle1 domain-containing protein, partial [Microcystis sp.]
MSQAENTTITKKDAIESVDTTKKKRLVVCCDGTWNELATSYPTNVVKFARLVKYTAADQTPQMVHYISGCGTAEDADLIERLGGGAFG